MTRGRTHPAPRNRRKALWFHGVVMFAPIALAASFAGCAPAGDAPGEEPVAYASEFTLVKVEAPASPSLQIAVHACAGLYNRKLGGSVFVQTAPEVGAQQIDGASLQDEIWLRELGLTPARTIGATDFLRQCVTDIGRCVPYSYSTQHEILPAILTAAAALGAVPVAAEDAVGCRTPALDATAVFADKTSQYLSTRYVYEKFLAGTTGLAMLNPGYDRAAAMKSNPPLIDDMPPVLIDHVFARKLFVVFLVNGCIRDHQERELLGRIVNESGWETPVGVYGYNDSWLTGGYLYEAQTLCLDSANMGAIPTRTTNLSFFSTRRPPIRRADELERNPVEDLRHDPGKTYVAFVVGDGDNVRYIMSTRRAWLQRRLDSCAGAARPCPPLSWSISPHLSRIAPDVLQWYYRSSRKTGTDYFILPPSGHLYAYPSSLNLPDQKTFAAKSEADARLLGTRSVVHWEWLTSWYDAQDLFLPMYADGDAIEGIFPVNVPYLLEAFPAWPKGQSFAIVRGPKGGKASLFRPRSWRGVDDSDEFHMSPARMAATLGALPKGTVTWVYMTSDGGLSLENSYEKLIPLLPPHVQLVGADTAARLAQEATGG